MPTELKQTLNMNLKLINGTEFRQAVKNFLLTECGPVNHES